MKKVFFIITILWCTYYNLCAEEIDSLKIIPHIAQSVPLALSSPKENNSLFRFGLRIGCNLPFSKNIGEDLTASKILSAEFSGFVKIGKYVFADIGLGYAFQKNRFAIISDSTDYGQFDDIMEFRYLQIPIRVTGDIPLGKKVSFQPHAGIIYQPLIQVTSNVLGLNKGSMNKHPFLFTGGIGIKVYFVTLDLSYRYFFQTYLKNSHIKKPSCFNITIGFQY